MAKALKLVDDARRTAVRAAKHGIARGWSAVRPIARRLPVVRGPGWIALCYHRVSDDRAVTDPWLVVSPETFRRHVEVLRRSYDLVTARELAAELARGVRPSRPLCAITFDDGYADNLYQGLPVLERLGVPATLYVATDAMTSGALWYERVGAIVKRALANGARRELHASAGPWLGDEPADEAGVVELTKAICEALKRVPSDQLRGRVDALATEVGAPEPGDLPRYLHWDEVRELVRAGWEIGSHTRTHPILTQCTRAEARDEIRSSHETLVRELGVPPVGFSYPNGDCSDEIIELVRTAGFQYAVVAMPHQARAGDPYRIARRCISDHSSAGFRASYSRAAFLAEVEGALDRLR